MFGWLPYPAVLTIERGADAIVTDGAQISHFVAANGIADDKIFTAPLAVENERFFAPVDDAARLAIRQMVGATARPLVLAISRLVPEKGLERAAPCGGPAHRMRPVVAVVGTGPLGPELGDWPGRWVWIFTCSVAFPRQRCLRSTPPPTST